MGFLRCCVYYGILAVVSFSIGRLLPKSWFHGDRFPYRCASWEAKLFRFLRVHEWQDKVPDMSKIVPKLIPAKKLGTDFRAQLPRMIEETCVAEFTHFVLILLGFYALRLWPGTGGAVTGQTPKEIARTSLRLLSDKDALEKMGDALDAAVPHNAAANILSEMSEAEEEEKEEDLA